ncbi:hypothetical protein [Granulicella tundricola]|uniref:Uncharacterized protein n=1 Tax=Granulicella tundricola (strain ATCC BAA-1859 / DSM 23138 / MP5ACTX9) TaxID=1198114 RepID=E8X6U5_GRATM|nr:hypothetical protein [Granulicella tundricola]ADW71245.1 hypothetical protein AciX9_3971 [Granulicella tundricola MP5ACTX9]
MRHSDPPAVVFAVLIPVLVVFLVFSIIWGLTSLWAWGRRRRLAAFAAAHGLSFQTGPAPITVPQVAHDPPRRLRVQENFLYGSRKGVEVFACDFRSGEGRGSTTMSMVAVRGDLRDTSLLDPKRWQLLPLNGWSFLIPNRDAGPSSRRKIGAAWDLLTAAVVHSDSPENEERETSSTP